MSVAKKNSSKIRGNKTRASTTVRRQGFGKGRPRQSRPDVPPPNTIATGGFNLDHANKGDGLTLLRTLPNDSIRTAFFDPQYPGGVKDWAKVKAQGGRYQKARSELHQMDHATIAKFFAELSRIIAPSGHVFLWIDAYHDLHGIDHWLAGTAFTKVGKVAWRKPGLGLGWRVRSTAEYLLILQKLPKRVVGCWTRRDIPSVWEEAIVGKVHTHSKPLKLQMALIDATTQPGDLVLDPCAGSFSVLEAAQAMGRRFIGCDLDGDKRRPAAGVTAAAQGTPQEELGANQISSATRAMQPASRLQAIKQSITQEKCMSVATKKNTKINYEVAGDTTVTWLTPKPIIKALGPFDLDPCTPEEGMPWRTARKMLKPSNDGLATAWKDGAMVWMNPPYGKGQDQWMEKMAKHGNGIALVMARMEVRWMHDFVFNHHNVSAVLFTKGRLKFHTADGTEGNAATAGSVFIAYGTEAAERLRKAQASGVIAGHYIALRKQPKSIRAANGRAANDE